MSKLVIVESPAKAKTIKKYLGSGYKVIASMGHLKDLPKSELGVDIQNSFTPKYITIRGKGEMIAKLKKEAKGSQKVFLATDPDREGEAISRHLAEILSLDENDDIRITFNEITKSAVTSSIKSPRKIDKDLADAQQARRILDRIVGYKISPMLWKKIKKGLSAGRVQSVATKLIVDREREIRAFIPEEYWTIDAFFEGKTAKKEFSGKFYGDLKKKIEIKDKETADKVLKAIDGASYIVKNIKKGERQKSPQPPFITSTLQQDASRKLRFQARKTMSVAQELYEGRDIKGQGSVGLITYMRTDSLRVSFEALSSVREFISEQYGEKYLPEKQRFYKTKKNIQDAHEAIRPTDMSLSPSKIKGDLTNDQYKLYKLIWDRFVASQMENAVYNTLSLDIEANKYLFKASGQSVKFDGFTAIYSEAEDKEDTKTMDIPELSEGDILKFKRLEPEQKFTQPPARFTEASLIKALEDNGIGRPGTYAPTITTIMQRGYVQREQRTLLPTYLGEVTTDFMSEYFKDIVDIEFTAEMEEKLDLIESGDKNWIVTLQEFYGGFEKELSEAMEKVGSDKIEIPPEVSDVICEHCGRNMIVKTGKFGKFLACPGFPECRNTKPITKDSGVLCPECGSKILIKKTKNGKKYFGCEKNPECGFMSWDEPQKDPCPNCGGLLLKKTLGPRKIYCYNKECNYEKAGK